MRNAMSLICATLTAGLFVVGCAGSGEEVSDKVEMENDAAFSPEAVDDGAVEAEEVVVVDAEAKKAESELNAKYTGPWSTKRPSSDRTFHTSLWIPANTTVTCVTSNQSGDPAMAILQRNDGCGGAAWYECPGHRLVGQFNTMDDDDDSGPDNNALVSARNGNGNAQEYLLVGWAYGSSIGKADVTCTFSNGDPAQTFSQQNFTAGSLRDRNCDQGSPGVHTNNPSGHDMALLVIPYEAAAGNAEGRINDDDPDYGYPNNNAHIANLNSSQSFWYVGIAWSGDPNQEGKGEIEIICGS